MIRVLASDGSLIGDAPTLGGERLRELFVHMLRIRCIDERMLKLQRAGRIGFVGTATGLEAAIIGSAAALDEKDWLWSGLREGGAALMRGLPLIEYVSQMYGNADDTAKGRQMCNHFQHRSSHYPSWSSCVGTQITHGVGAAYAAKQRGTGDVHAIYFGDGATSSNSFHSGMNFAAVWCVPAVFVCIDNGWAISVASDAQTAAESFADKASAYGMPGYEVDGNDVLATYRVSRDAMQRARGGEGPSLIVLKSYRMLGHSSSDDPSKYRSDSEVAKWAERDPIARFEHFLVREGALRSDERESIRGELLAQIDEAVHQAELVSPMPFKSLVEDVYADVPRHLRRQYNHFIEVADRRGEAQPGDGAFPL